jgi:cell wall-associated NlpC family hydrolase
MNAHVARVIVPIAPLLAEPRASATMTSQCLNGHRIDVLEAREDWRRVQGPDAYEGWMHRGYLGEAVSDPSARLAGGHLLAQGTERLSLGCVVRSPAGRLRALPLGALVDPGEDVLLGESAGAAELRRRFPPEPSAIVDSALRLYEGTSYLWGGVTPWGADCSGFVQTVFALHGIRTPRDAKDQAQYGVAVPHDPDTAAPADLLFFSDREDGRITHTGIALGESRLVHLALGRGGYAVEDLRTGDAYAMKLRERIRFARRITPR